MTSKILTVIALFLGMYSYAQQTDSRNAPTANADSARTPRSSSDQQPNSESNHEMENWIDSDGKTVDRLVSLGVSPEVAQSIDPSVTGGEPVWVRWKTARAGTHERLGLLFLPCHAGSDTAYLYTLTRREELWHAADHMEMDCHYDDSVSFESASIRDPKRDEILVHHACAGHGTGYLEQDFSVFAVSRAKLKEELETEEVLRIYRVGGPPRDETHDSTFTVVPIRNSRSRAIEQTRSIVLNGKLTVQRRTFRWDVAKGKYIPSAFRLVEAAP